MRVLLAVLNGFMVVISVCNLRIGVLPSLQELLYIGAYCATVCLLLKKTEALFTKFILVLFHIYAVYTTIRVLRFMVSADAFALMTRINHMAPAVAAIAFAVRIFVHTFTAIILFRDINHPKLSPEKAVKNENPPGAGWSMKKYRVFLGLLVLCVLGAGGVWAWHLTSAKKPRVTLEWMIEPQYNAASDFRQGVAWVREERGGDWQQIDTGGRVLIDRFQAEWVYSYGKNTPLAVFQNMNRREGYIDLSGNVVIEPQYSFARSFQNGLAVVAEDDDNGGLLYGAINSQGEMVLPIIYDSVWFCEPDLFAVRKGEKWGYMNRSGDIVADFIFDKPHHTRLLPGVCMAVLGGKAGLLDDQGQWILPASYDYACSGGDGLIGLVKDNKVGFVDAAGNTVIDFQFISPDIGGLRSFYTFSEGLAAVLLAEMPPRKPLPQKPFPRPPFVPIDAEKVKGGVIDTSGKLLFEFQGMPMGGFYRGLLLIRTADEDYEFVGRAGERYPLPTLPSDIEFNFQLWQTELPERVLLVRMKKGVKPYSGRFGYLKFVVN